MLGLKMLGVAALATKHVLNSCSHLGVRKEACRYMGKGRDKRQGKRKGVLSEILQNLKQETRNTLQVTVLWDVENCGAALPPPCPSVVFRNIKKYLHDRGIHGLIQQFEAYGNGENPQLMGVRGEIGLWMKDDKDAVFIGVLYGIYAFVECHSAPDRFVLLSANRDFARALRKLEERGYPFIVAELTDDGEIMEWPEMNNLHREESEPNICDIGSIGKGEFMGVELDKSSEPNTCESTPGKIQCVTRPPCLGIFWDLEICGVPKGVPCDAVPGNIKKFLSRQGINLKIATFNAYGDVSTLPQNFVDGCNKSGISLTLIDEKEVSVEKGMMVDMFMFAIDNPSPSKILLISNKRFYPALFRLGSKSTIMVAVPDLKTADPYFCRNAGKVWEWPELAMDGCTGEEQLSASKYSKFPGVAGMLEPEVSFKFTNGARAISSKVEVPWENVKK